MGTGRLADQSGTITKGSESFDDEVPVVFNFFGMQTIVQHYEI